MTKEHRLWVGDDLVLYGDVGDMWGDGSGFTAADVRAALTEIGKNDEVMVAINSPGGIVNQGMSIYNVLKTHPGKVTMSVDGIAASAASLISMAGDDIVMREGAMMMIHDPAGFTWGNAEAHDKASTLLNTLGDEAAKIYARRSGKSAEEAREVMRVETWLTAEQAVEEGFATETVEDELEAVAAFDWSIYASVPGHILKAGQRPLPKEEPASAKQPTDDGDTMTKKVTPAVDPAKDAAAAIAAQAAADATAAATANAAADAATMKADPPATPPAATDHTQAILQRCVAAKMSLTDANEIITASGGDLSKAQDMIIDKLSDDEQGKDVGTQPTASVTRDGRDKFVEGATLAVMARAGMDGGERNEFSGLQLREMARMALSQLGVQIPNDPMMMVQHAFNPTMAGGMHSTSDFTTILANVANKSMLKGFEEAEETFESFTATGTLTDFKIANRIDLNLFPSLAEVPEGAEYHHATIGERGSTIQLATYGRMFAITRQAIINDDMSVFTRIPSRMGRAAKRTVASLVWALVTANGTLPDGDPLFHANHGNLAAAGAAPSVVTLSAMRVAMALQKDPDGIADGGLNIRAKHLLVPIELEDAVRVLLAAEFNPAIASGREPNSVRGMVDIVSDARLSAHSTTAWYGMADANSVDTIEVAYLNGVKEPVLEQRDGWNVDGVEYKVRLDAGANVHDFRGMYKNPGA